MKTILILSFLFTATSCSLFSDNDDVAYSDEAELENEAYEEPAAPPPLTSERPLPSEINWKQWKCCIDVCASKTRSYDSVFAIKHVGDGFIDCICKNRKRVFRLRKVSDNPTYRDLSGEVYQRD